jgi:hypothetical protein
MSDVELQNILGFDHEDLAANRRGHLSPKQAKRIKNTQRLHSVLFAGAGIVAVLVITSLFSTFATPSNRFGNTTAKIGLPAVGLGFIAWGSFKISAQKADQTVQCVRGRVRFIKVEKVIPEKKPNGLWLYRSISDYELRVGNRAFENVNQKIFSALKEQDIYTFYYTKESKDILSAE